MFYAFTLKSSLVLCAKVELLSSVDKIIDINLDILTVTYSKNEQAKLLEDIVFIRDCVANDSVVPFFSLYLMRKLFKFLNMNH